MKVRLNGVDEVLDGEMTLDELVARLGIEPTNLVIELNGAVLSREEWPAHSVHEGDAIEMVRFVGGG
ncbi:MAG: sulfur carrier protein ThiS [Candidatus Sumerlaeia bacterium]|nr:sulfur carrier protein ThiS [Candidatus Sumerlaeia bacterium]